MAAELGPDQLEEHRRVRRLVSSLRARGGLGAVSAACHADVPDVGGVVLSVRAVGVGWIMLSDSGPLGDHLEDLYISSLQGPGPDAALTGETVAADDLRAPAARSRWPRFAPEAAAAGIRCVLACPVSVGGLPVGVLNLYRGAVGPVSTHGQVCARRYGEAVAVLLRDDAPKPGRVSVGLPVYAGEIQQAIGIVMELAGVDAVTALKRLRTYARRAARPMADVVAEVRAFRLPFDPKAPA
jgi:ANTAR domain-containing protein